MTRDELKEMDRDTLEYLLEEVVGELDWYGNRYHHERQTNVGTNRGRGGKLVESKALNDGGERARKRLKELGL